MGMGIAESTDSEQRGASEMYMSVQNTNPNLENVGGAKITFE